MLQEPWLFSQKSGVSLAESRFLLRRAISLDGQGNMVIQREHTKNALSVDPMVTASYRNGEGLGLGKPDKIMNIGKAVKRYGKLTHESSPLYSKVQEAPQKAGGRTAFSDESYYMKLF